MKSVTPRCGPVVFFSAFTVIPEICLPVIHSAIGYFNLPDLC